MSRSKKNANRDIRAAVATHNICHLDGARPPLPRARRPAHTRLCYSSSSEDRRIGPLVALPLGESRVVLPVKLNAVLVPLVDRL